MSKMTKAEMEKALQIRLNELAQEYTDFLRPDPILMPKYKFSFDVLIDRIILEDGISEKLLKAIGVALAERWLRGGRSIFKSEADLKKRQGDEI